jgi:hypothetical protein
MFTCALAVGEVVNALNDILRAISTARTQPSSRGLEIATSLALGRLIEAADQSLDRVERYCGLDVRAPKYMLEMIDIVAGSLDWDDALSMTYRLKSGFLGELRQSSEVE